jgi:hypothetical protein
MLFLLFSLNNSLVNFLCVLALINLSSIDEFLLNVGLKELSSSGNHLRVSIRDSIVVRSGEIFAAPYVMSDKLLKIISFD